MFGVMSQSEPIKDEPIKEGPEKSFEGWEKLPPDKIGKPQPVVKDCQTTLS
jgi:hypothetical protein